MTYAFHTPDKLCFILDLMNGGDLHYHLSQHGVFNENEMRFYGAEVILGEWGGGQRSAEVMPGGVERGQQRSYSVSGAEVRGHTG